MIKFVSIRAIIILFLPCTIACHTPSVTLIFVIDQCAYHYTTHLKEYFKYGIHSMLAEGIVFTNAHYPHATPVTCVGHTALNTGAYADIHGITGNVWYQNGVQVACDDDITGTSLVINPQGGLYQKSKSSQFILVDGISDQFVLSSTPGHPHAAYSFGIKSRTAIATANKLGKAFWFDEHSGMFTTSTAYLQELPAWLVQFNMQHEIQPVIWKQKYESEAAYPYGEYSYQFIAQKPLINNTIPVIIDSKKSYDLYCMTPAANQLVIDCSMACIDNFLNHHKNGQLLVWICLGSLDKLGHTFGPRSKEIYDMLYWLDAQIGDCIHHVEEHVGKNKLLTIFTSDHGVSLIPEEAYQIGLTPSIRVDTKKLIAELNNSILLEYSIENMVLDIHNNTLYLNHVPHLLKPKFKNQILNKIKAQLETCPYIAHAWLPEELQKNNDKTTIPYRFKRQFFRGRSGDIAIEVRPFVQLTAKKYGTDHTAPYTYNTHVPLMLRWPDVLPASIISTKVTTTQLAPTLAQLLHISQPAAAEDDVLPGVIKKE